MAGIDIFEGDILLEDSPDFGEMIIEQGLIVSDRSFGTAVYISLFGGNKDDSGKVKNNKTWWGNTVAGISVNEKMISRFQNIIFGLSMTSKNIQTAENAALLDLKWLMEEKIADKIEASGRAAGHNLFELTVSLQSGEKTIFENTYSMLWRAGIYGETV